jgi:hypothetical protein
VGIGPAQETVSEYPARSTLAQVALALGGAKMYTRSHLLEETEHLEITAIQKVNVMLYVEFPSGQRLDFETPEALARAVAHIKAGTPIVVRSEKDGSREILWTPADED